MIFPHFLSSIKIFYTISKTKSFLSYFSPTFERFSEIMTRLSFEISTFAPETFPSMVGVDFCPLAGRWEGLVF